MRGFCIVVSLQKILHDMTSSVFTGTGSQRSTIGNTIACLAVAGNGEDRSDTWSVDAVASDSEADPVQRNDDLLMIDDPDGADNASGLHFFKNLSENFQE